MIIDSVLLRASVAIGIEAKPGVGSKKKSHSRGREGVKPYTNADSIDGSSSNPFVFHGSLLAYDRCRLTAAGQIRDSQRCGPLRRTPDQGFVDPLRAKTDDRVEARCSAMPSTDRALWSAIRKLDVKGLHV